MKSLPKNIGSSQCLARLRMRIWMSLFFLVLIFPTQSRSQSNSIPVSVDENGYLITQLTNWIWRAALGIPSNLVSSITVTSPLAAGMNGTNITISLPNATATNSGAFGTNLWILLSQALNTNSADIRYLQVEADPQFEASPAAGMSASDLTNLRTMYSVWGDHHLMGYLLSEALFTNSPASSLTITDITHLALAYAHSLATGNPHSTQITNIPGLSTALATKMPMQSGLLGQIEVCAGGTNWTLATLGTNSGTMVLIPTAPLNTSITTNGNIIIMVSNVWSDASSVTSGVFNLARLPGLDGSNIVSGVLSNSRIPGLTNYAQLIHTQAFNTITGTLALAQLPSLYASNIVYGIFSSGLIPPLDGSIINSGFIDASHIPTLSAYALTAHTQAFTTISGVASSNQIPALDASKIAYGTIDAARLPALGSYLPLTATASNSLALSGRAPVLSDGHVFNRVPYVPAGGYEDIGAGLYLHEADNSTVSSQITSSGGNIYANGYLLWNSGNLQFGSAANQIMPGNTVFATNQIPGLDTRLNDLWSGIATREQWLSNPTSNGQVLSSTTGGTRSWITLAADTTNTIAGMVAWMSGEDALVASKLGLHSTADNANQVGGFSASQAAVTNSVAVRDANATLTATAFNSTYPLPVTNATTFAVKYGSSLFQDLATAAVADVIGAAHASHYHSTNDVYGLDTWMIYIEALLGTKVNSSQTWPFTSITGVASTNQIPSLDASKITQGVLVSSVIPPLNASKITTGKLDPSLIPGMPYLTGSAPISHLPAMSSSTTNIADSGISLSGSVAYFPGDINAPFGQLYSGGVLASLVGHTQPFTSITGTATAGQIPSLPESQITGLTTDLAGKSPTTHTHAFVTGSAPVNHLPMMSTTSTNMADSGISLSGSDVHFPRDIYTDAGQLYVGGVAASLTGHTQPFTSITGTATTGQIPQLPESQITSLTTDLAARLTSASAIPESQITGLSTDLASKVGISGTILYSYNIAYPDANHASAGFLTESGGTTYDSHGLTVNGTVTATAFMGTIAEANVTGLATDLAAKVTKTDGVAANVHITDPFDTTQPIHTLQFVNGQLVGVVRGYVP